MRQRLPAIKQPIRPLRSDFLRIRLRIRHVISQPIPQRIVANLSYTTQVPTQPLVLAQPGWRADALLEL